MTPIPARPKIYHITHVDNLAMIVREGGLLSDHQMVQRGGSQRMIGMSRIKRRRLEKIEVDCHPGTRVGDYVPFYFCPRSVMLYVLHCANEPELTYRGGQEPIVHLEADLHTVVDWAARNNRRWAFSRSNAGAFYTEFRASLEELDQLNWAAIGSRDFRDPQIKDAKQAEFLLHEHFPFVLVERLGVASNEMWKAASRALASASHRPRIETRSDWYF